MTTTYTEKSSVTLVPVMEVTSMVKTSSKGITDAAKSLRRSLTYGMCSEAIESYSEFSPNDICIKPDGDRSDH